jgi:hypothetical protein
MSTIVPTPVRVKPPPAESGETISPTCAALTGDDAGERRAHHRVVEVHPRLRDLRPGRVGLAATRVELRGGGGDRGARLLGELLRRHAARDQRLLPLRVGLRLAELRLGRLHHAPRPT